MLIVVDVGNTTTEVGVWRDQAVGSVSSRPTREMDAAGQVKAMVEAAVGPSGSRPAVAVCCTVPEAEASWREWADLAGAELFLVRGDTPSPLRNWYRRPQALGGDRLAAAVGAEARFGAPVIVAGLGTALVVDAVSEGREYLGGAICAGVDASLAALAQNTRTLPRVRPRDAEGPIGGDTEECLAAGATHGTAGLVEGLTERMRERVGSGARLVLTGGDAALVSRYLRIEHQVAPTITLEGLGRIWEHNRTRPA